MQRLGLFVLVMAAACGGGGPDTGPATLSGVEVKGAASETFAGPDAAGNSVMGWNILLFEDEAPSDCKSGTVLARIAIYTNQAEGSADEALLTTGGISIVTDKPPMLVASTAANMSAEGVGAIQGIVEITEFHLEADAKHADRIAGTISAGGFDASDNSVSLTGEFVAPLCD